MMTLEEFEEGDLPRKLFFVAMRKSGGTMENLRAQRNRHDRPGLRMTIFDMPFLFTYSNDWIRSTIWEMLMNTAP